MSSESRKKDLDLDLAFRFDIVIDKEPDFDYTDDYFMGLGNANSGEEDINVMEDIKTTEPPVKVVSNTPKASDIPPVNYNIEITFSGDPRIDKYLDILKKCQCMYSHESYQPYYKKIELYIKGEITSNELTENITEEDEMAIDVIYWVMRKLLNYRDKKVRYYIRLPIDMFFLTGYSYFIYVGEIDRFEVTYDHVKVIGPDDYLKKWIWGFYEEAEGIEIDGDFSQIPNGTKIQYSDYLKILQKYPNIIELTIHLMKSDKTLGHFYTNKSDDEMKQLASERLQWFIDTYTKEDKEVSKSGKKREGITALSQETIDSITVIQPVYLTKEEILNGDFGTFEELLARTLDSQQFSHQSDPILTRSLPSTMQNN